MPRGRADEHLVARNLLHAPARRTKREDVPHARLIDHFLIELAHAARGFLVASHEENAEHTAVGNGTAVGHRHALRPGTRGEHAGHAVIDHAGFKLRKIRRGIHATDQIQHGIEDLPRQIPIRPGSAHGAVPFIRVHSAAFRRRHRRHRLLCQNIQRIARRMHLLNKAILHTRDSERRLHKIRAVLGIEGAVGDRADRVPGAAHTLQTRGHGRRRFHLHHQFHRSHVDAKLQGAGGHHGLERSFLEHGFRQRTLVLGYRAVMGTSDNGRGFASDVDLLHQLGRVAPGCGA